MVIEATPKPVLSAKEAAAYLNINLATLYTYAHATDSSRIPGRQMGRKWLFLRVKLDEWLKNEKVEE
jgi:excisionase family DNA binding protein